MSYLLTAGVGSWDAIAELDSDPQFRRATPNMKLAYLAARPLLSSIPAATPREDIGIVIGTSLGELSSTYDFFAGLAREKVARPLAFQNSLHNSTLGFLSKALEIRGPGVTTSRGYFSGEDAIELGGQLLLEGCPYVIVIGVDSVVDSLRDVMTRRSGFTLSSGAGALLLSQSPQEFAISGIIYDYRISEDRPEDNFYDSNAVEQIARGIVVGELFLPKPDGTSSRIVLGRASHV